MNVFHIMESEFSAARSEEVDTDEMNRLVGVWAFNGWDLEYRHFRTPEGNGDVHLVIARNNGATVCVAEMSRPGAKELGLDLFGLEDIVRLMNGS